MDVLEEAEENVVLTNEIIESGYEELLNNSGVRDQYEEYMEEIATLEEECEAAAKETKRAENEWYGGVDPAYPLPPPDEYQDVPAEKPKTAEEAWENYQRAQQAQKQLNTELDHARKGYADYLADHVDHTALDTLTGQAYQNYNNQEERLTDLKRQKSELEAEYNAIMLFDHMDSEDAARYVRLGNEIKKLEAEIAEALQSLQKAIEIGNKISFIYERKEILLESRRPFDKEFVVQEAMVQCTKGMRRSFLIMPKKHNILIKGRAFFNVGDTLPMENLIPFGGCLSQDNEDMDKVVKEILRELHDDPQYTVSNEKADWDELKTLCVCPCRPEITKTWTKGHSTVKIGGQEALLGRCELTCNKGGGVITICRTGQPE